MTSKVRYCSDLHTEFWKDPDLIKEILPELEDDKDSLLILAGDIGNRHSKYLVEVMESLCERFKDVFYIPGNHEYYGGNFYTLWDEFTDYWFPHIKNLHMGGYYEDDTIVIIGETLWTDFENGSPLNMHQAKRLMNDYNAIKSNCELTKKLNPEETYNKHKKDLSFIKEKLEGVKDKNKTIIVVSHHAPSLKSVHPIYANNCIMNSFYFSDLEEKVMLKYKPDYWIHGHTHTSFEYTVGKTKVFCNPFGYYRYEENRAFKPKAFIEV